MLNPEDFEIPLEKDLKMRIVYDEIDACQNIEALQENLKNCAASLMKYQHLLSKVLEAQLHQELQQWEKELQKQQTS